jgi:hypothetical protein
MLRECLREAQEKPWCISGSLRIYIVRLWHHYDIACEVYLTATRPESRWDVRTGSSPGLGNDPINKGNSNIIVTAN